MVAFLSREFDIAKLLIDRDADLTADIPGYIYRALNAESTEMFQYILDKGFVLEDTDRTIWLLFYNLKDVQDPLPFFTLFETLELSYAQKGGKALRSCASYGDVASVEFLLSRGVDIDFHDSDMIFPNASTPLIEAARFGCDEVVRCLIDAGADLFITDKYGDRPYTAAVSGHHDITADYIKSFEPPALHDMAQKDKALRRYKLPKDLVDILKEGPHRFDFPSGEWTKWIELMKYTDNVEVIWHRMKFFSFVKEIDRYGSEYAIAWRPKDRKIWCLDWEHDEAYPIADWDSFLASPGKYINGIFNGDFLNRQGA